MTEGELQDMLDNGPVDLPWEEIDVVDEDWLSGISCNPDAPEECESCQ